MSPNLENSKSIAWWPRPVLAGAVALGLAACGTDVQVGKNDDPSVVNRTEDEMVFEGPEGESEHTGSDGVGEQCFGKLADGAELAPGLVELCADRGGDRGAAFAKALTSLCEKKELVNLLEPRCGWAGSGEPGANLRVLERTELDDAATKDFTLFAAYAVKLPVAAERYIDLLYQAYGDPEFSKTYRTIKNSKLSNVTVDREKGRVDYTAELATSAATVRYRGLIEVVRYPSGFIAVYDRAMSDKVLVKESRLLILVRPVSDTETMVVGIDDKIVDDGGNHRLAFSTAVKLDKERMEVAYENAK